MPEEKRSAGRHTVILDRRENMSVTGVLDVISFDEETVVAETELGVLILRGTGLHVSRLNLESGELAISGELFSLQYEDSGFSHGRGGSLLGRLFK